MNEKEYSKAAMKRMMDYLPLGTMGEIAKKYGVKYTYVQNVCYGRYYHPEIISEVERRFNKAKKSIA